MEPNACETTSLVALANENQLVVVPLRCRKWSCPKCGPRQKKKLIRRFVAGSPDSLLTLTTNPAMYDSKLSAFLDATRKVNLLFKRLRRAYPRRSIQYALVWEVTKKGWPHAHILLRAPFIPKALISQIWHELTGAWFIDIRAVQGAAHVAGYVAKYITKSPEVPPGCKRFRTSRSYSDSAPPLKLRDYLSCGPFERWFGSSEALRSAFTDLGAKVTLPLPWLTVADLSPIWEPPRSP